MRRKLWHLVKNHLWTDTKLIVEKELEADTEGLSMIFGKNFSYAKYITNEAGPSAPAEFQRYNLCEDFFKITAG